MLEQNPQLYVFILVIVLLLIGLLWYLLRNSWKAYAARITADLLASNPDLQKIDWSPISPPDPQGIRTTSGTYQMTGGAGQIRITAYGKDVSVIEKFTAEAKFYFVPIFVKLPQRFIGRGNRRSADSYQKGPERKNMMTRGNISPRDLALEQENNVSIEFARAAKTTPRQNETGKEVQVIAFIMDPRLAQDESHYPYWAYGNGVYVNVSASEGSVTAGLNMGGTSMGSVSVFAIGSGALSSESYGYFYLNVTGTSGTNYYRLSGTWNDE